RRSTGAAGDLEDVLVGSELELGKKPLVLAGRRPAVLADVDPERLLADELQHRIGEVAVVAVEIDALGHATLLPLDATRSAPRAHNNFLCRGLVDQKSRVQTLRLARRALWACGRRGAKCAHVASSDIDLAAHLQVDARLHTGTR